MHTHTHNLLDLLARWRKCKYSQGVRDRELPSGPWSSSILGDFKPLAVWWLNISTFLLLFIPFCKSELPSRSWILMGNSLPLWEYRNFFSYFKPSRAAGTRRNIPKTFILHYLILPIASAISCQILSLWPNIQGHSIPSCCFLKEIHLPYFATQISWEIWVHRNFSPPTALQGLSL